MMSTVCHENIKSKTNLEITIRTVVYGKICTCTENSDQLSKNFIASGYLVPCRGVHLAVSHLLPLTVVAARRLL